MIVGFVPSNLVERFSQFLRTGKILARISGAESLIGNTLELPVDYMFYGDKASVYNLIISTE